jgi:hypothetical protein
MKNDNKAIEALNTFYQAGHKLLIGQMKSF